MQDMHQDDVVSSCIEQVLVYHDDSRRKVYVADQEVPFPEGKLIVSRTNEAGIITHGNQSFVEMSGFTEDELIGQPHHILRHPDMPKAAFKDLWDTLARGEKWSGYVKNLRKDGAYYWVLATVVANIRGGEVTGYTSVRRKPSRERIAECIELYRQMRLEEAS
ncbi:PAS domain-containing protein [Leucothrix pacifica]|uniref:Diguanylate cyclase n=1 Tax=Leucothrix pacifica TaxID=1247513 RepID=A0A317CG94_9GAMM|nr:PAS domain-containing protein [Leucothrix pacifica]PWQ97181.1 diguanylate cyclase [Leucothrix pacifica]